MEIDAIDDASTDGAKDGAIVAQSALLRVVEQVATPARVAGVLAKLDVKEGDIVARGALLGKIDDDEAKMIYQRSVIEHELAKHRAANDVEIRSAEKALQFTRTEYFRLQRAADELPGSISQSEVEEAQVTAAQAELDLEQAKLDSQVHTLTEQLKKTERAVAYHSQKMHDIAATVNGMVVEILRRRGEWVEPGEDVLRIMRIDRLRAEGLVDVADVMQGIQGAAARITVAVPGREKVVAKGRIVFINPEINPVNGRVRVRAEFENPGGRLMPGMRAELVIFPNQRPDTAPTTAVMAPKSPEIP